MKCFTRKCRLMGSSFELGIVENFESRALHFLEQGVAEIQRIEDILSEFKPDSYTAAINDKSAKERVFVSEEVLGLIDRSLKISQLTKGYFDITVGPLKRLYRFNNKEVAFPNKKSIKDALKKTGYHKIGLDYKASCVYLKEPGMRISFAAIGKGYAADAVKKMWMESDVPGGYIDASGDLTAFGHNAKGAPWKIGIANPDDRKKTLLYVPLKNVSVATSGDYEQHFLYKGDRYSHNINPKTGLPLRGIKSVSIFSPSAELSDALATAVYAMGVDRGISFVNQLPRTHGIIINDQNNIFFSKHLQYEAAS